MSRIQVGRYAENLRRLLALRGQPEGAGFETAPELQANLVLESERPEWSYLRGERLYQAFQQITPAAAEFAQYRIVNPAGSGILSVVTSVMVVAIGAVSSWDLRTGVSSTTPLDGAEVPRDTRWGLALERVTTQITAESRAAISGFGFGRWRVRPDESKLLNCTPLVLHPGQAFAFVMSDPAGATATRVMVSGYERPFDQLEL